MVVHPLRLTLFKGLGFKKINVFKELTPLERTYELRGQGEKKKNLNKFKTNKHPTPPYKNYLQK